MFSSVLARKSIGELRAEAERAPLKRTLSRAELVTLGLGAMIGSGVFVFTGHVAANYAGPAIVFSFVLAGIAAALAGLCYAELASIMPVAGSVYTYTYASLGHGGAWLVAWAAVLEYTLGGALVAIGWAYYLNNVVAHLGLAIPAQHLDVAAAAIVLLVTALLARGMRQSVYATGVLVLIKVGVILLFVFFGAAFIQPDNWTPFVPPNQGEFGSFGVSGVLRGAGLLFYAYVGFDVVATAAQESTNPERDVPAGIMGSVAIGAVLYIAVALVLTGLVSYTTLGDVVPFSAAIHSTGVRWLGIWIELGALAGLTSVLLVLILGQTRMLYAMSRDGMLPAVVGKVGRYQTPYVATVMTGIVTAAGAALLPLGKVGELVSVGTLLCFAVVCLAVLILRRTAPDLPRPFKVRGAPATPIIGVLFCVYLMLMLPLDTWRWTGAWFALGIVAYAVMKLRPQPAT